MSERENLQKAIAALEAQRDTLGDAVVDTALAPLRQRLAALAGQRRKQATVLFADLAGFTALSETLDAEVVSDLMNALWERIDSVIRDHGGAIDKHIGDAVMALWGGDETREDDPERAIRAAMAMQATLADFCASERLDFTLRVGINTGTVLLGAVGTTGEFSAIGDAVNVAARLEEAAPLGHVLISHDTYRHVRGIFDVQPQDALVAPGKAEPVRVYLVERAKPRVFRPGTRGIEGIETRLVGREDELAAIQEIFRQAMTASVTRCVTLVGEAGVGKSRLLHEFENWVELLPRRVRYFKGRATPEMESVAYGIIRDMFAYRFDIRESDRAATVLRKFRAGMEDVLPPEKADVVGHFIGFDFRQVAEETVGKLLGSTTFGDLARAYLLTYLRVLAAQPTVILLEDIHWADDSSLALLEDLIAAIPDARLLIVCLARPALFERWPSWGQDDPIHRRLALTPLSEADSRALIREILQKAEYIPDHLCDLIVQGAEGNPFYVEEFIKMLIEDGIIISGAARWHISQERLTRMQTPPTLFGILQARLDSLPRAEKKVLQRASVVGRRFWDAVVASLRAGDTGQFDEPQVEALLTAAHGRELIFHRQRSAFAGAEEYIFKHALLRDVIYETVLLKRRRVYHAQIAAWLESHAGERLDEYLRLIARHYELAGQPDKAVAYLQQAGEAANQVSAYPDAIAALEQALALLPEDDAPRRAPLLVALGYAYRQTSSYVVAIEHIEEALKLAREVEMPHIEVAALNELSWAIMGQGRYAAGLSYLYEALDLACEIGDRRGEALSQRHLADIAYRQGRSEDAARHAQASLALSTEVGDRHGIAYAHRVLGFAALLREEYEEAVRCHQRSYEAYQEVGDRWGMASCFINMGETRRRQGKPRVAAQHYQKALDIFREIDSPRGTAICVLNLGHAHAALMEDAASQRYLREALDIALDIESYALVLETMGGMALLHARAGRKDRAAELLGVVLAHPALNEEIRTNIQPALTLLRKKLSAARLNAALARGQELDWNAVVAELLA